MRCGELAARATNSHSNSRFAPSSTHFAGACPRPTSFSSASSDLLTACTPFRRRDQFGFTELMPVNFGHASLVPPAGRQVSVPGPAAVPRSVRPRTCWGASSQRPVPAGEFQSACGDSSGQPAAAGRVCRFRILVTCMGPGSSQGPGWSRQRAPNAWQIADLGRGCMGSDTRPATATQKFSQLTDARHKPASGQRSHIVRQQNVTGVNRCWLQEQHSGWTETAAIFLGLCRTRGRWRGAIRPATHWQAEGTARCVSRELCRPMLLIHRTSRVYAPFSLPPQAASSCRRQHPDPVLVSADTPGVRTFPSASNARARIPRVGDVIQRWSDLSPCSAPVCCHSRRTVAQACRSGSRTGRRTADRASNWTSLCLGG